jgi:methionyl-tRNA synthetase
MAQPFMPASMAKLLDSLGVAEDARQFADAERALALAPGALLPAPTPIFPRYVEADAGAPGQSVS